MNFCDDFRENNRIDKVIFESESEMENGGEVIELDEAFKRLNKKYYKEDYKK